MAGKYISQSLYINSVIILFCISNILNAADIFVI